MKILIVEETDWLLKGPHNHHHFTEKLSLRGHDVRVMDFNLLWRTDGSKGLWIKKQYRENVAKLYEGARVSWVRPGIIRLPVLDYISHIFSSRREIFRQIKEYRPDIIIGFSILNTHLASRAARQHNIPFVYYWIDVVHALIPFKPFHAIGKLVEKMTFRQGKVIGFATNKKLRDYIKSLGAAETHIVRFGIDFTKFKHDIDTAQVRQTYGIEDSDIVLTFVGFYYGRLANVCGLKELALGLKDVRNPHLKLMIIGEGTLDDELREIQRKYNLEGRLILTGKRPYQEIPALLKVSSICLLSFRRTGLTEEIVPLKIFDYMAMGKPVISVRLPGMVDEFGEDAGIVYVDKPEDIYDKAEALIRDGKLTELGARSRQFIAGRSWDNVAEQIEGMLDDLIRKRKETAVSG
ncbi:MAG: glycosyltransferase [Chloroflexi bacterium]|nr:glycosyltransferase [Chloroflexota bacterium]